MVVGASKNCSMVSSIESSRLAPAVPKCTSSSAPMRSDCQCRCVFLKGNSHLTVFSSHGSPCRTQSSIIFSEQNFSTKNSLLSSSLQVFSEMSFISIEVSVSLNGMTPDTVLSTFH